MYFTFSTFSRMSSKFLFTFVVLLLLLSVSCWDYRRKGDNGRQCRRDTKGAWYGTDPIYSSDDEGCCDPGFHYLDSRCVGCPYGLRFTNCKHSCTLYCDTQTQKPFVNCSFLADNFFSECEAGCECPPGMFETSEGECVYIEQICPNDTIPLSSTCPDVNSFYSECQSSCITTCRNLLEEEPECAAVCVAGCRCNSGYVLDESTSLCALPANCTVLPSIAENSIWACCEGNCLNPFPSKCDTCEFGSKCKGGFVRNDNGDCVDYQECDSMCDANEIYDMCASSDMTCDNYRTALTPLSTAGCRPGCQCKENYVRKFTSGGGCVLPSECPLYCTEAYEVTGCSSCHMFCNDSTTWFDCSNAVCSEMDTCICDEGYARDGEGNCIMFGNCPSLPPIVCDASLHQMEVCSSCVPTCDAPGIECTSVPNDCSAICGCTRGYLVDMASGECVLPSDCPVCDDCVSSDNNQNYKQKACLPLLCSANEKVDYTVRFVGTWNDTSHPSFGFQFSHWSPLTGASHKPSYEIWENCFRNVTQGVQNVAETGNPMLIAREYNIHSEDVLDTINNAYVLPGDGEITRHLEVNKNYHYITLLSMMGNTKDYMVGVDRLDMCGDDRVSWKSSVKVCLELYSTGTKTELADICSSHSRQFSNCSFGYIEFEFTANPQQDVTQCQGEFQIYTKCNGYCQARCEYGGNRVPCPRICIEGCKCIDGYARNDKDECVPLDECDSEPNARCTYSSWVNFAIAMYAKDPQVRQMRYITQSPTGSNGVSTCPSQNLQNVSCDNSPLCLQSQYRIQIGCAVWIDTCYVEFKCGTTTEFEEYIGNIDDNMHLNYPFFEPMRKHDDTSVGLTSLDFLQTDICASIGDKCLWDTFPA